MDNKNVFVAIALSMSVLLFWGAFFETPKKESQNLKIDSQIQQKTENQITPSANQSPSINQINIKKKLSRDFTFIEFFHFFNILSLYFPSDTVKNFALLVFGRGLLIFITLCFLFVILINEKKSISFFFINKSSLF